MTVISIIVPCYDMDRFKDITELLDSINAQTYSNLETIIVAERSPELANSIREYITGKNYPRMLVIYNEGPRGVSAARNLAIGQAKGDIIAFVDDDAILFPGWAEEMARTYRQDDSTIGVTGPVLPRWQEESTAQWFPREFYWIFSCTCWDLTEKTRVRNGYGTNISFRSEAFKAADPFQTSLGVKGRGAKGWQEPGAEEAEFSIRLRQQTGKSIIYNPAVKVWHKVYKYRTKLGFVIRRAFWEGYAKALLGRLHRSEKKGSAVLSPEYTLLRRILFWLIPRSIGRLFVKPFIALRQLWLIMVVLLCVSTGYITYGLTSLLKPGST